MNIEEIANKIEELYATKQYDAEFCKKLIVNTLTTLQSEHEREIGETCEICNCTCGCHPCKHTSNKEDLVASLIECGIAGYKAVEYVRRPKPHAGD